MTLFTGIQNLYSLAAVAKNKGRNPTEESLSLIKDAAILINKDTIQWVGPKSQATKALAVRKIRKVKKFDLKGVTVLPAFIDPHTHMVFAGDRRDEFELRHKGFSYQEIADRGGGIMSTVRATRGATPKQLLAFAIERETAFVKQGVATVEIKSGYGLDLRNELKMLKVAAELKKIRTIPCFLGAHTIPSDFKSSVEYINEIMNWLPRIRKHAGRIDIFIETSYFTIEDAKRLFEAAKKLNFQIAAHTDQMNPTGATVFAAKSGAVSVDHCIRLKDNDIIELSSLDSTCVLLPGSDFYLHLPYPPARRLIDAGVRVALGTDFNPGTCPTQDISLIGVLARLEMKMTLPEVIVGLTYNAARALGLADHLGSIEVGKKADFVCIDGEINSLFYQVGHHPVRQLWRDGRCIFTKK